MQITIDKITANLYTRCKCKIKWTGLSGGSNGNDNGDDSGTGNHRKEGLNHLIK